MQVNDQLDRTLSFPKIPKRIISLVPSQTELIVDLGLLDRLVGITKFCVHPENLRSNIQVVGGTKQINLEKIRSLNPDIIICNKEENTKEMVLQLEELAPVWVSDVDSVATSLDLIDSLGLLFSVEEKASAMRAQIELEMRSFVDWMKSRSFKKVAYLIWKNPYMAAGQTTFINELLRLNKFDNVIIDPASRYPEIGLELLKQADLILLSSEPYPFKEDDVDELKSALQREVRLVDGEYFSWYGSRLQNAFSYFRAMQLNL